MKILRWAMIRVENLNKSFGTLNVLKNVSTSIKKGEIVSIIGPSGSGKSTFLRCINLLETPSSGKIFIEDEDILQKGTDVNKIRQKVSMVFQHFNLFANKTVLENIILAPIKTRLLSPDEAISKARTLLERIGLLDKQDFRPHKLSGGQKQRIAIIRSLCMNPKVILFDEPTSALDPEMVGEVLKLMQDVAAQHLTMIVVTHEMGFAKNVGNRVLFMDKGKIEVDSNTKDFFENPQNERLKEFLNEVLNH